MKKYKFLNLQGRTIKSNSGNTEWKVGKWNRVDGELDICEVGLHCSRTPYQAFSFDQGEVLAIVETKGKSIIQDDKECWSDMRILKAYRWTKKDSVAFSIYAAELVIKNYEKEYPDDKRPREAIEAAKKVLFRDTAKNRVAARSAARSAESAARSAAWSARSAGSAAWSAESARSAAGSAAWSAESARSAARSAAWSAESAAWSAWSAESAESAARSAAGSAAYKKLGLWMQKRIKKLKKIKQDKKKKIIWNLICRCGKIWFQEAVSIEKVTCPDCEGKHIYNITNISPVRLKKLIEEKGIVYEN